MAVVFHGFSIREYASQKRSVDVAKCWPFTHAPDTNISVETVQSLLPPITVTKFRWWAHELHLLNSSSHRCSDVNCPVCGGFTAANVNGCLAQAPPEERRSQTKPKSRIPKKRSIVEIFAVAPQIHRLDDDDDNRNFKTERQKTKKKNKRATIARKLMVKKKKKQQKLKKERLVLNKGNTQLKLQNPVKFTRKQNSLSCKKRIGKDISGSGAVPIYRKKRGSKFFSTRKKSKVIAASKLIMEHKKLASPVRGILKNHRKVISGKNSKICNLQGASQASDQGICHSVKHVSFLVEDDMPGAIKKTVVSFEKCVSGSDSIHPSKKGYCTESDKEVAASVTNGSDDDGTMVQIMIEKQQFPGICDHVDTPSFSRKPVGEQEKANNFSDKSVSLHQVALDAAAGFALTETANETAPLTSQFTTSHALSYQAFCHLPQVKPKNSLSLLPEWNQKIVAFRENDMDGEVFGLPLNSHGELVCVRSSGKSGFNQLKSSLLRSSFNGNENFIWPRNMEHHSIMKEKHFIQREVQNDQLNLFHAQNHAKENPCVHSTAILGPTELSSPGDEDTHCLNSERSRNQYLYFLDSEFNMMNSLNSCKQYDELQNQKWTGITHRKENADHMLLNAPLPTMRLMGKDVTIGKSDNGMQGLAGRKVWTGKEIVRDDCSTRSARHNSAFEKHFQCDWYLNGGSGKFKETSFPPFESKNDLACQSNVLMQSLETGFFQPAHNLQTSAEFQNKNPTVDRNHNPQTYHFSHAPTSHAIFSSGVNFLEPFISETGAVRITSQLPLVTTLHRKCQDLDSAELKYKQNLLNATQSSLNFPFMHPDHGENVQQFLLQSPSKTFIPWLLQATHEVGEPIVPAQSFPNVASGTYHPCTPQTNLFPNPSVHHSPIFSYDHSPMITHSCGKNPFGPPSVFHSPLIPSLPRDCPAPSVNMSQRNRIQVKDRMKLKDIRFPDMCQKSKKRPGAKEDYSANPTKIAKLGIQDGLGGLTQMATENICKNVQCSTEFLETEFSRDEASCAGGIPNDPPCNELEASFDTDSSRVDGVARLGPRKLSAGVKHILKPSQKMNKCNSRPIHSTIPFASVTDCSSLLGSQKSTKIYRF
ncbi:hypothetical protein SLEP1_g55337 [Rubroshorea leprosula]|uniref:Uncharacterized protein n=1 Tax=Rubroshorea leprosula TaxID=152421 RepID=A0AAV5MG99_9ROSI|nr:hypothetical protein SLEP1_g55337 [Rubroshorea leprosula]